MVEISGWTRMDVHGETYPSHINFWVVKQFWYLRVHFLIPLLMFIIDTMHSIIELTNNGGNQRMNRDGWAWWRRRMKARSASAYLRWMWTDEKMGMIKEGINENHSAMDGVARLTCNQGGPREMTPGSWDIRAHGWWANGDGWKIRVKVRRVLPLQDECL